MSFSSLQLNQKNRLMQRSRRVGHGVVVSKTCYVQYSDCVQDLDYRLLFVLALVTCDCCKPVNNCRDWVFSHSELEVGLSAFQLPMFVKCDALPKRDLCDMLICRRNPFPPFLFGIQKHPLPTRSLRFLRAAVRSTSSAVWYAHPFVAAAEKDQSHAEKLRVWSRSCGLQELLQYTAYWSCSSMTAAN